MQILNLSGNTLKKIKYLYNYSMLAQFDSAFTVPTVPVQYFGLLACVNLAIWCPLRHVYITKSFIRRTYNLSIYTHQHFVVDDVSFFSGYCLKDTMDSKARSLPRCILKCALCHMCVI